MSDRISFSFNFYSPRQSSEDIYQFDFERNQIKITGVGKHALCKQIENLDLVWSGHLDTIGNPFEKMLENDSIYPPTIFVVALERVWKAWIKNDKRSTNSVRNTFTL